MTAPATTGLRPVAVFAALAAVLLIGAASVALIGSFPVETARPTTTATAAPTAIASTPPTSPSVTPVAVRPLPRTGSVAAGTYRVEFPDSPVTVDLTLEDRWKAGSSFTEQGAPETWNVQYLLDVGDFSHTIWFYGTVANVNTDGCDWEGTQPDPPVGPTVDDFIAALDAQQNTDLSNPVDVVLDGYAGKRVDMRVDERSDCIPSQGRDPVMWVRPNGQPGPPLVFDPILGLNFITVWILDVDGHRVVVDTYLNPAFGAGLPRPETKELLAQAEAEVMAVMDSMEFAVNEDGQ